jgi:hypothetical protein
MEGGASGWTDHLPRPQRNLAFHLTMSPGTIAPALVACVLWILVFLQYRESFRGIFSAKAAKQA